MAHSGLSQFDGHKYLSLESYRRNGQPVRTPVWFAEREEDARDKNGRTFYVYTIGATGKVKRIRNNRRVRIAPCDIRGRLRGDWVEAQSEILTGAEAKLGMRLLNRKYAPWKQLLDFLAMFRSRKRVVFAIRAA